MGTRALDLDQWFLVDRHRDAELALRRRLLVERNAEVFAALPSASRASEEVAELIASWAAARGLVGLDAPPPAHPLAVAGLLVQEDLCLMVRRDGAWRLDGAVLCFPSMWVLAEKLGHTVGDVHRPVDHYDTDLEPRVDVFFDRLRVDRPVWRRNFSLKTTPALFLPTSKQAAAGRSAQRRAGRLAVLAAQRASDLAQAAPHRRHPVRDPGPAGPRRGAAPAPGSRRRPAGDDRLLGRRDARLQVGRDDGRSAGVAGVGRQRRRTSARRARAAAPAHLQDHDRAERRDLG